MLSIKPIGANQTELTANGMQVLFSYKTPVACWINEQYYKTDKKWSKTTTKHINKWRQGQCLDAIKMSQEFFDNLVSQFDLSL